MGSLHFEAEAKEIKPLITRILQMKAKAKKGIQWYSTNCVLPPTSGSATAGQILQVMELLWHEKSISSIPV
jgi:hypothetical protein